MWVLLGKFANQNSVLTEWTWVALWLVIFSCFLLKKISLKKNYKYLFHWLILTFNITNFRLWPLVSHQGCMHPWGRNAFLFRDLLLIRFYLHLHQTASFVQWKGRYITSLYVVIIKSFILLECYPWLVHHHFFFK